MVAFIQFLHHRRWPLLGSETLGILKTPTIRFTWARDFGASLVRFRCDLPGCSPPLTDLTRFPQPQETFTSRLSTIRSPSSSLDITTAATGQFPPVGLSPTRTAASFAAPDPSVHVDALGSSSRTHRHWRWFPRTRQTWLQQRMPPKKLLKRGPTQGISTTPPVEPLLPDLADAIGEFQ